MSDWRGLARRLAPLLFILLLAVAILVGPGIGRWHDGVEADRGTALLDRIADLSPGSLVVVAFDPDLVTYAEVRPAARAVLDALDDAGLRVAIVSFSPEGRAIANAELARRGDIGLDIGFVSGGEAGIVSAVRSLVPPSAIGPVAEAARSDGGGLDAFALALVIGGGDIGPRLWAEQVAPRAPELPIVAIVPAFMRPELEPYLASGQLDALVAGPDGVAAIAGGDAALSRRADGVLAGMLVAIVALLATGIWPHLAQRRSADAEAEEAT